ncbi:hypothetical protein BGZ93_008204 [Podila epicladia]|nr:hypothetical protein BGZ92_004018 [Podila epicladia]KAG0092708.1 hypothetical protein BGZ93_008204 [Podila epicladia]
MVKNESVGVEEGLDSDRTVAEGLKATKSIGSGNEGKVVAGNSVDDEDEEDGEGEEIGKEIVEDPIQERQELEDESESGGLQEEVEDQTWDSLCGAVRDPVLSLSNEAIAEAHQWAHRMAQYKFDAFMMLKLPTDHDDKKKNTPKEEEATTATKAKTINDYFQPFPTPTNQVKVQTGWT